MRLSLNVSRVRAARLGVRDWVSIPNEAAFGAHSPDVRNILPTIAFGRREETLMNSIIYLVGLVVVVLAILSFVGLR